MAEHILVLYVPPALFHFTDTATPETYTLSLHDALPILSGIVELPKGFQLAPIMQFGSARPYNLTNSSNTRSEEHTSELQSRGHPVSRLLLEKKRTSCRCIPFSRRVRLKTFRPPNSESDS